MKDIKVELYHDNFQNFKRYNIPRANLVVADIPYNTGDSAYGSNPMWYIDGDNKKGESELAGKQFFNTDKNFNLVEYMHFCNKLLKKEPKERNQAPAMIIFCAWNQMEMLADVGRRYGFKNCYPMFFIKNYSPQVLKANMRIVGATEHAVVLYRDKLPKFRNNGRMIFNWMEWPRDNNTPKIHPNQKPVPLLKRLIEIFTDEGDIVIDPVAGSGTTLKAAAEMNRHAYGFEVDRKFYKDAKEIMLSSIQLSFTLGQTTLLGGEQ